MLCPPWHLRFRGPIQSRRRAQIESEFQGSGTCRPGGRQCNRGVRLTRVGGAYGQSPNTIQARTNRKGGVLQLHGTRFRVRCPISQTDQESAGRKKKKRKTHLTHTGLLMERLPAGRSIQNLLAPSWLFCIPAELENHEEASRISARAGGL